jgi:tocopherol O-methyltransferase
MQFETKVREFYDVASHCYEHTMGDRWHHGDPTAEAAGKSFLEACEAIEESLVRAAGLRAGHWALDFGSGIGGPAFHMARVSGARFVGVTNNEQINQRARARAVERGLERQVSFVTLADTDYRNLPFADASFDAVMFCESVCHLPDKAGFFCEAARVLKPGGRLAGTDWMQRPFGEHQTEAQIMQFMAPVNEHIRIPWHGTVDGYRRMLQDAGLDVLEARDLFENVECWGSTPPEERELWLQYAGPDAQLFVDAKHALDAARRAGVFTIGMFVAAKPR